MSTRGIVKYDELGIVEILEPSLLALVPGGGSEERSTDVNSPLSATNYVCARNLACPDINACNTNVVC